MCLLGIRWSTNSDLCFSTLTFLPFSLSSFFPFCQSFPFSLLLFTFAELMLEDMNARSKKQKKGDTKRASTLISAPQDFRRVCAIVDADMLPDTVRRVKLLKHSSDRPLGFYIRDGTSVRVTAYGLEKVPGIFISRLVPGGLAESTGLLAVNDEILEVNGIEVLGKSLDQVTDMMVANSQNLIITVKPASQPPVTPRMTPLPSKKGKQQFGASMTQAKPINSKSYSDLPSVSATPPQQSKISNQIEAHKRMSADVSTPKTGSWAEPTEGTSNGPTMTHTKQKEPDDVITNKRHSVPTVLES